MVKVALFGRHQQLVTDVAEATETLTDLGGTVWVRDGVYYLPASQFGGVGGALPSTHAPIPKYRPRDL